MTTSNNISMPPPAPTGYTKDADQDQRNWAMFCHLAVFAGCIVPFANFIAPLVLWLIKKDEMPYVNEQGKEVLNFQITVTMAAIVSLIFTLMLVGFLMLIALAIFAIIMSVIGAIKANGGEQFKYPLTIRLIK